MQQKNNIGDSVEKRVAYHIRRMRKLKGLTQLELANLLEVKQPFIARIESGRNNLSIKKLEQISKVFCVDPHMLLMPIQHEE